MRSHGKSNVFRTPRMIRRTEISIETRRVRIVRRRQPLTRGWCDGCLAEVQMITPTQAAALAEVSSRTIYRWIEEARLHFTEEVGGLLLVCADSLLVNE